MGAFDSIKNALGLSKKKKNVTTHPQNIQNRRKMQLTNSLNCCKTQGLQMLFFIEIN